MPLARALASPTSMTCRLDLKSIGNGALPPLISGKYLLCACSLKSSLSSIKSAFIKPKPYGVPPVPSCVPRGHFSLPSGSTCRVCKSYHDWIEGPLICCRWWQQRRLPQHQLSQYSRPGCLRSCPQYLAPRTLDWTCGLPKIREACASVMPPP
ncbi:hypothetical protein K469DRAFT_36877 [Zopfia rhizophila CBS 207.26]|uniref:Uncharacterized protein n=1 Tax=Zopfia rhizophila CBS 207.26 TaxID=1314779 RepID=A0A6A6DAU4_9PEZI|nr:hypothetical protein K469DRAFT_36877 [Zopfia rhizophila CBS 207.26]